MSLTLARRTLLGHAACAAVLALGGPIAAAAAPAYRRVRPGEPGWPSAEAWKALGDRVGGRLSALSSPWEAARKDGGEALFAKLRNPFAIGDDPALTSRSAGRTPGPRSRAPMSSPHRTPATCRPRWTSRARTGCGWS